MSSSCIEDLSVQNSQWYRIASEMLQSADIEVNGSRPFDIRVKNPHFFKRVLQEGSLGLGESYMDGWWECDRLDIFFQKVLRAGLENQLPHHIKDTLRVAAARLTNLQSKKRAWIVGKEHYDLGNDLFSLMLDPYMQYSCGYWKDATTLKQAQEAKLKLICEKLQLKPGMTLLDIGCGWGGLAAYAAKHYGVSVEGVTISAEQQKLAQER
ncbi:MAG: class I SAM-dependent methyltransferase, partial [Hafnia sp.]